MKKTIFIITVMLIVFVSISVGIFYVNALDRFDIDNPDTWFDIDGKIDAANKNIGKIDVGMSFEEIVKQIGKPQRDVGSGNFIMEWDTETEGVIRIVFNSVHSDKKMYNLIAGSIECEKITSKTVLPIDSETANRDSVLSMYNKDGYLMDVLKNTNRYAAKDENLDTYDFSTVVFGLPAKSTEAMRENYIYMNAGRVDYYLSQYDTAFPIQLITPIDENTVYVTYRLDRDGTEIYAHIVFEKEVKYLEAGDGIDETGNYEYWENRGEYYFENREIPSDCYTGLAIGDVLSEERMNELAFFTDINRCYYSKADGDGINPSDDSNITEEVCVSRDVILKFEMQYHASQNTYTIMSIEPYSCLGR